MRGLNLALLKVIGLCLFLGASFCFAQTITVSPLNVRAEITPSIEASYTIFKGSPTDGVRVDTVSFGVLTDRFPADTASRGAFFSLDWYTVLVTVGVTGGVQYEVTQTATALTSGTAEIPANAYLATPVYSEKDEWQWRGPNGELNRQPQGAQPGGSVLHSAGSAVETNKKVYTSEVNGSSRIIQIIYSLTNGYRPDGGIWAGFSGKPIPLTQPAGIYSGRITITVTTI